MRLYRALPLVLLSAVSLAQIVAAQKPLTFAVSTVKPASKDSNGMSFMYTPSGLTIQNFTLAVIIRNAYELQDDQVLNLPDWAKTARFDIEAKVEEEDRERMKTLPFPERTAMVRALLAERFHLKTHADTRELPVFNLTVTKGGAKMPAYVAGTETRNHGVRMGRGELHGSDCSMELLTRILSQLTHHLVVDKTGLTPHYNFDLTYADENAAPAAEATSPSIYTALQEQLGLKLETAKAQMPVLVVDGVERPTDD